MTSLTGFEIAGWHVDPSTCQLSQGEVVVKLEPKVMDLLVYMAEHSGEVLSRDELLDNVWQGVVVGPEALTNAIIKLRKAFGDDARHPRVIKTYPKKGYRLVAEMKSSAPNTSRLTGLQEDNTSLATTGKKSRYIVWLAVFLLFMAIFAGLIIEKQNDSADIAVSWILPPPEKPSIAVLPFVNTGNEAEYAYFSDGITDDLINDLSRLSGLFVIARNSTFQYKGQAVDVRQVAATLGVKYLLEGSVRRGGSRVRVNVQLINGESGVQLWSDRYDGELADVFDLQDQIRNQIITALALKLSEQDIAQNTISRSVNPAAYDALLKGLDQTRHFTRDSFALAESQFRQALEIDPSYARAHAALAMIYWRAWQQKWHVNSGSRLGGWVRAKQALEASMTQPTPDAYRLRSSMFLYNRRYQMALDEAAKAITLNPNSATGYLALAQAQAFDGQPLRAIDSADSALRLDPQYPAPYLKVKGRAQFDLKLFDQSIETLQRAIASNPDDRESMVVLLAAYGQKRRHTLAADILAQLNQKFRRDNLPEFTQDWPKNRWPYRQHADRNRLIEGLKLAGVPEW